MMSPYNNESDEVQFNEIMAFVLDFFHINGASTKEIRPGVWSCSMPDKLSQELNYPAQITFTFSPSLLGKGVEMIALGSPLLEGIISMCRSRGKACSLIFMDLLLLQEFEERLQEELRGARARDKGNRKKPWGVLRVKNAKQRVVYNRLLFSNQIMFCFKVAYVSDEKQEEIVSLLVDPLTEEVDQGVDLKKSVAININIKGNKRRGLTKKRAAFSGYFTTGEVEASAKSLKEESYNLFRLYRKACDHIESSIENKVKEFKEKTNERLKSEVERVQVYYHSIAAEAADPLRRLLQKMTSLGFRAQVSSGLNKEKYESNLKSTALEVEQLQNDYNKGLSALEEERERRLAELYDKYKVRVEIELTNIASIKVPRLERQIRLTGPARREITVMYDILRSRFMDLECELCGEPSTNYILCSCGNLVCRDCANEQSDGWSCLECTKRAKTYN